VARLSHRIDAPKMNRHEPHLNWTIPAPETTGLVRCTAEGIQPVQDPAPMQQPEIPIDLTRPLARAPEGDRISDVWSEVDRRRVLRNPPSAKVVFGSVLAFAALGAASFGALYLSVHHDDRPAAAVLRPAFAAAMPPAPETPPLVALQPTLAPPFGGVDPLMAPSPNLPRVPTATAAIAAAPLASTPKPVAKRVVSRPHPVAAAHSATTASDEIGWGLPNGVAEPQAKAAAPGDAPSAAPVPSAASASDEETSPAPTPAETPSARASDAPVGDVFEQRK
jgi:hypothetical protein